MRDLPEGAAERLESAGLVALHESAPDELRSRLGLELMTIEGALVAIAAEEPSILFNRTIGLGMREPASEEGIRRICAAYRERGVERYYLGVHPKARPDGIRRLLEDAGLRPQRGWMKFERGPEPAPKSDSSLQVRLIDADHVDDFGRIAAAGFDLSTDAAELFRGLSDHPAIRLYMTFDGPEPAGTGLVHIDGEHAWLDWAATDPTFRRRGSQRALLERRIDDAIDAGCTRLLTATGVAVPGDSQHSYHNIEWAGFEPAYVRENWGPD
ncbi:MAG: GNAT family N-acetyltransferase [Halobacteriota archaeon]